ncbi:MAG: thioesterase domain-containing protein, partial [Bacteroidota bacterium]
TYSLECWQGGKTHGITSEGHGRVNVDSSIDHSQTVGWFTDIYPVKLTLGSDMGKSILSVKQSMRQVPNKGLGWGAFCMSDDSGNDSLIKNMNLPPISFNYLGQLDRGSSESFWQIAGEASGRSISGSNAEKNIVAVNGVVINNEMSFVVEARLPIETVEKIAEKFRKSLIEIAGYCVEMKKTGITPGYDSDDFEYIPTVLLNENARSNKLAIIVHPDSGYEAYMATLYPVISKDVKVILVDNFYKKVYLKDGVAFEKYDMNRFGDLAEYYVDLLMKENSELIRESECILAGYSFGSPIACEMERILKEKSVNISLLCLVDPLIPKLLNPYRELDCFEWYKDYIPAHTDTPIVHFRCTIPDPLLSGYTEHFVDPSKSSLKSISDNIEEINIKCVHTAILNNTDFINRFKEFINRDLRLSEAEAVKPKAVDSSRDNRTENIIRGIIRKVMELDETTVINGDENIFQLGCTSIQSLSVIAMINQEFSRNLNMGQVIQNFTVKGLAESVEKKSSNLGSDIWKPLEFSFSKNAPGLYFFPGLIGSVSSYNRICARLSEDFNVKFLEPKGMYGTMVPFNSYEEAIGTYADEIAGKEEKDSIIYLTGHSIGSIHSIDTAIKLEQKGFTSIRLINIDGYLYGIKNIRESIHSDNLDEALLGAIKIFFQRGNRLGNASIDNNTDPLQQIASILFPGEEVSRDYSLRVALGYRNIWHQQLNEMLNYKEPSQKFRGKAFLLLTKEAGEDTRNRILKSCQNRYAQQFKTVSIPGDHLSCIIQAEYIEYICGQIQEWTGSLQGITV